MDPKLKEIQKKLDKELKTGIISVLVLLVIERTKTPCYGYRIIKIIEVLSNGRFKFPEGTIYPILNSLLSKGLLSSYWGDAPEGPKRKYYKITTEGRKVLSLYLQDWHEVSNITNKIIKGLGMNDGKSKSGK